MNRTDSTLVSNYLLGSAAKSMLGILDNRAREISNRFGKTVSGMKGSQPLWKTCAASVGVQVRWNPASSWPLG